jgi:hypothetical protein
MIITILNAIILIILVKNLIKKRSLEHPVFPSGHPSKCFMFNVSAFIRNFMFQHLCGIRIIRKKTEYDDHIQVTIIFDGFDDFDDFDGIIPITLV